MHAHGAKMYESSSDGQSDNREWTACNEKHHLAVKFNPDTSDQQGISRLHLLMVPSMEKIAPDARGTCDCCWYQYRIT